MRKSEFPQVRVKIRKTYLSKHHYQIWTSTLAFQISKVKIKQKHSTFAAGDSHPQANKSLKPTTYMEAVQRHTRRNGSPDSCQIEPSATCSDMESVACIRGPRRSELADRTSPKTQTRVNSYNTRCASRFFVPPLADTGGTCMTMHESTFCPTPARNKDLNLKAKERGGCFLLVVKHMPVQKAGITQLHCVRDPKVITN